MTQQIPASSAQETENIPFHKRIIKAFKPKKTTLPILKDEYGEIMGVDDLCQKLEDAIQAHDRELFGNYAEKLKKLVHDEIIPRREGAMRVHEREKEEIERLLTDYLSSMESGNPILKYELLNALFRFIRRGDPTRMGEEAMVLDVHTLLQAIKTRNEIIRVYGDKVAQEQTKSRRRLYGVLGAGAIAVVTGVSAWNFYDEKKDTQEMLERRTTELRERDLKIDLLKSGVPTSPPAMAELEQKVDELRAERERVERELESARKTLQQIQAQEQAIQQREEELLRLEQSLQQRQAQVQTQAQQVQEREQKVSRQEQTLEAVQVQIQELERKKAGLEKLIHSLQVVLREEVREEVSPEILLRAETLREKARSGNALTAEEIQIIRTASEAMIAQWREETAAEIRKIREAMELADQAGTNTPLSRSTATSRISRLRNNLKSRTLLEQHERESLIAIAGMRS